jgi:hypothetical protein
VEPWSARLWYAYADTVLALGRPDEAREWFAAAATVDRDGETDAAERVLELDGVEILADEDDLIEATAGEGTAGEDTAGEDTRPQERDAPGQSGSSA